MQSTVLFVAIPFRYTGGLSPILFKIAHHGGTRTRNPGWLKTAAGQAHFSGAESSSFGNLGKNFLADSGEHRHQTGGCLVLRNEGIDHI